MDEVKFDKHEIEGFALEHERELLKHEAESLRTFYSLTGPARKDYAEQMIEVAATRIRAVSEAKADGLLALKKAQAEGLKLIGEALASCSDPDRVLEYARLQTIQAVARDIADGKATKLFLPQNFGELLSFVGATELARRTGAEDGAADVEASK